MSTLFLLLCFILSNPPPSSAQKTLSAFSVSDSPWGPLHNQTLTLLSPNSLFAAGFLALSASPNLFNFSIWYRNISAGNAVVWSANPIKSPLGPNATLSITAAGALRLVNSSSSGENLWPGINASHPNSNRTSLVLRNDGNLIYGDWQSFHFPTDTVLPNQSIDNIKLFSNNGKFIFTNSTKLVFNQTEDYQHWDNAFQKLDSDGKMTQANGGSFIVSDFGLNRSRRLTLDNDGNLRIYSFDPSIADWIVVWQQLYELCQVHGTCGPNAICVSDGSTSSSNCVCPPGFKPAGNGVIQDEGCERKIPLSQNTQFLKLDYVNFTGGSNNSNWPATNFTICQSRCLTRPHCEGFMFKYDGTGYCVLQLDRLLYGYWSPGSETAMFLRVDQTEKDRSNFTGMTELLETTCPVQISLPLPPQESNATTRNIVIICTLFAAELISGMLFFWAFIKKYIKYRDMARTLGLEFLPAGGPKRFSYAELKAATKDFSDLIGRGGFGDVYRGELTDQRVVAVKCLKHVHVAGGDAEFWAEVTIIARMHHLNLVRLWGFCAEKGQRILVYEYVPNGSLDKYLFRPGQVLSSDQDSNKDVLVENEQKPILDWGIRYRIALGVARSIAYLHEECLEWVLHCDIKPENILLGDDFCPKISDFGLAKLKKKEDMVTISRMQGTRGYMAPEWAKAEQITPKADVYSFGMVLLELVSGVRSSEIQGSMIESADWYFPRWAFDKVFKEMNVEDILDRQIKHCYDSKAHFDTVNRMVKTAMWCLQDRPEMRPSMGKVAKMLEGTVDITEPKKPTIFFLSDD